MFRLRNDARAWFMHVHDFRAQRRSAPLPLRFDVYYTCLMAGLATGKKLAVKPDEATDIVDNFPDSYRPKGRIIIALFLSRELKELAISPSNRTKLHATTAHLVDPHSPSRLSAEGFKQMNRYAHGGFDVLSDEWFEDKPRIIETFLPRYKSKLAAALQAAEDGRK